MTKNKKKIMLMEVLLLVIILFSFCLYSTIVCDKGFESSFAICFINTESKDLTVFIGLSVL